MLVFKAHQHISCEIDTQIQMSHIFYSIGTNYKQAHLHLKSLGPIDRKFHGHGENDGFVLYEYIIKQCSSFCKYTNISVMKKKVK